jgi:hypothetical protein
VLAIKFFHPEDWGITGSGVTNMVFPFDKSKGLAAAGGKIDGSRSSDRAPLRLFTPVPPAPADEH